MREGESPRLQMRPSWMNELAQGRTVMGQDWLFSTPALYCFLARERLTFSLQCQSGSLSLRPPSSQSCFLHFPGTLELSLLPDPKPLCPEVWLHSSSGLASASLALGSSSNLPHNLLGERYYVVCGTNSAELSCPRIHVLGARKTPKNLGHLHLSGKSHFLVVFPFDPGSMKEPEVFRSITSRPREGLWTAVLQGFDRHP